MSKLIEIWAYDIDFVKSIRDNSTLGDLVL